MTAGEDNATADIVDLVFGLDGSSIAADYADRLWQALCAAQPWFLDEPALGVHPLGRIGQGADCIFLSRHSRLVLRLPRGRMVEAGRLTGSSLDLGGTVMVGAAKLKPLKPEAVLYSPCVLTGAREEDEFLAACRHQLDGMVTASAELIVGRTSSVRVAGREEKGYSLMVHGCRAEDSLRLQRAGLGAGRQYGCGLFVPHKSVVAVGER